MGFFCGDLLAVLVNYNEGKAEKQLVVCSAYLSYDSKDPHPSRKFEELMHYCEEENLYLVIGLTPIHTIWCGVEPIAMIEGWPCWNF